MTDAVLSQPVKESFWLVQLRWGDPDFQSHWELTDANEDLAALNYLFVSRATMAIRPVPNGISFERKLWEFDIPLAGMPAGLLAQMENGRAHSPIDLKAMEISFTATDTQILYWCEGRVSSVVRNPSGHSEMARLRVQTLKLDAERALGVPMMTECEWTFGDEKTCDRSHVIQLPALVQGGLLTAVDGLTVTITGLSAPRNRYFNRGHIEKDGVRILIKEWISGTSFLLARLIPLEWEESLLVDPFYVTVSVTPGCDKKLPTCALWENVANFFGAGLAIPAYNPSLGTGG